VKNKEIDLTTDLKLIEKVEHGMVLLLRNKELSPKSDHHVSEVEVARQV
jgi:hypothetical protein